MGKEFFALRALDKGAEVPSNHHTRRVSAVPSRHRCASPGWLENRTQFSHSQQHEQALKRVHLIDKENQGQGHTYNTRESQDSNPDLSDLRCDSLNATHITLGPWLRGQALGQTTQIQVLAWPLTRQMCVI